MKYKNQTGSVLAISLVLLTAITLIAMMGLQRSGLQTKIVANIQHDEMAFQAASNEQEFWYDLYNTRGDSSKLLFDIMAKVDIDNEGARTQAAFDLEPSLPRGALIQLQVASNSLYVPPEIGSNDINLAAGHDIGNYTNHYFQLDSAATFQNRPSIASPQRTGFHFPALVIGKNSL